MECASLALFRARVFFRFLVGLGEAAKRDIGSDTNQIPDMGAFSSGLSRTGWQKIAGGLILQWGYAPVPAGSATGKVLFPVVFPKDIFAIFVTDTGAACLSYGTTDRNNAGFTVARLTSTSSGSVNGFYLAIGI
ncbi:phage tail protein [Erwinia sp. PK3-005]